MANKSKSRKDLFTKSLTMDQFTILKQVMRDVFFFASLVYIVHPMRGRVLFKLYSYQKKVLYYFLKERFNIILKFRQAGLSELIALYALWLAMYHPHKNIQIISIKDKVAKRLLARIKFMYKNLPEYLQVPIVNGKPGEYGTMQEIEFSNGSRITSVPTTEDAGRSEAVSLLVIDEAAIVRYANTIWAAAFPTLSTGGSAIINSCITGDTEILSRDGYFRVDSIAPKKFGKKNIEKLGIEVLTHTGKWQKVIGAINKGELETWEVEDNYGETIKCTPAHRMLTTQGWKTTKEIVTKKINIIKFESGIKKVKETPKTKAPDKEIIKTVKGFSNYSISNLGKVYINKNSKLIEKDSRKNKAEYHRIKLWNKGENKTFTLSRLVAEHFIGKIPMGFIVDHINCDINDNHVNNLQIISPKENSKRAIDYSTGLNINQNTGKGFPNIILIAKIKEKYEKYKHLRSKPGDNRGSYIKTIAKELYYEEGIEVKDSYISRVINNKRAKGVKISKLKIKRKFIENIYDISVNEDQSYVTKNGFINHNTPFGMGNWYHQTWVQSMTPGDIFHPIRLKWTMHPERDMKWYQEMATALGPRRTSQEIDGNFLTSGYSVFDLVDIKAIEDELVAHEILETRYNGCLRIFRRPKAGVRFFIGADIATGRGRDYSAFTIMDSKGEEYAVFKGRVPIEKFTEILNEYGRYYNNALLAPEANDIGLSVVIGLQQLYYPNLYYSNKMVKEKGSSKPKEQKIPGWLTHSGNRSIIIDELEADIRNDTIIVKDKFFCDEAYTFIYDNMNRPVAMGKGGSKDDDEADDTTFTDDSILAKAITNHIRKTRDNSVVVVPR